MTKELSVILYVLSKFPEWLYQTLLYKYLFYIDFYSFSVNDKSLTDAIYYKLPYWPVPLSIKEKIDIIISKDANVLDSLPEDQKQDIMEYWKYIEDEKESKSLGFAHKLKIKRDMNYQIQENDKAIIDEVFLRISKKLGVWIDKISTNDMVNISHQEKAYIQAEWWQPLFYGFCDDLSII